MKRRKSKKILKQKLWNKTNGKCANCGKDIDKNNLISANCISGPKEERKQYNNLIPLCRRCGKLKKSRFLDIDKCIRFVSDEYNAYYEPNTIYSLNNSFYLDILKGYLKLNSYDVYKVINDEFLYCNKLLKSIGVEYSMLKKALVPTKKTKNREVALWFDTNKIPSDFYGYEIFTRILSIIDKESTFSVLMGDYIDVLGDESKSQKFLKQILTELIQECNKSEWVYSNQYYVVYFNNITKTRLDYLVDRLKEFDYFYGYTDLYTGSLLKSYLSRILINGILKTKNKVIMPDPDEEISNTNIYGYPFEDNNFQVYGINEDCFSMFLSYKIETMFVEERDYSFSLNAIFPKFEKMNNLLVDIPKEKWEYLIRESTAEEPGKGGIISSLDETIRNPATFSECIKSNLSNNYIYNLRKNSYGVFLFNICIALKMVNGEYRKTVIALKYFPKQNRLSLESIT